MDEKFREYYAFLKGFVEKTIEFEFGNGFLPQKYTEGLCRNLFKLDKYNGKKFDAIKLADSGKKETVEIKATLTNAGTTTLNIDSKFDWLYWMYFDFEKDRIEIYEIDGKELRGNPNFKKGKKNKRISVTLSHYTKKATPKVYDFNENTLK
ncbi:hypothetical protein KZO01_06500 [Kurthia zopfii]|uniref:Uncharacterized protein n=1 Tax=Kurthia zopfii TaxID=1650 RepID=A0A8B4Q947_9BACL|nr:hypothetical protein [Kurthia zopfii]PWI23482.1 hypothetical protein DF281_02770 [Kurthia zopfii]TDR35510.1 hypothetical protein DFR61_1305 [Kurthia zopfii]GEK30341.1 hypothetical protein KZO01_06500 [Kurthia zopfii]STX09228.1 Uncharacterised protein [Kurthia zopfii]